jgi:3-hydroxymyristoyl/3-hydroxydecanoyl-(acyl carrier protein) dehydratase
MRFRLVDRILSWEARQRIAGLKAVTYAECALKESWGGGLRLPDSLLFESIFQLGNWLIMLSSDFSSLGLIIRARRIQALGQARPGDVMRMEVAVQRYRDDGVMLNGTGSIEGRPVCVGEGCIAALAPLADFVDPEEMRRLYRELHRPDAPSTATP